MLPGTDAATGPIGSDSVTLKQAHMFARTELHGVRLHKPKLVAVDSIAVLELWGQVNEALHQEKHKLTWKLWHRKLHAS